ncbi:UNVERIFIED_CONTAM: Transcription termination factor MTEF18, mitochondrial [Sesamum radiatum]|uniref:Transcription termination factor MTEF18, mitochondrial n=1 Tax=Sesamum radiatum TaxID=300843 RepID=A0AAW2QZV5_SESRA
MLHRRTTTTTTTSVAAVILSRFTTAVRRHFSKRPTTSNLPKPFSKIPWKHRSRAIQESQKALTDYLHTTRALPFPCADHIACNSPQSLWKVVSEIPFSRSTFGYSFQRYLRYHPINELDFFLESIGLNCDKEEAPIFVIDPSELQRKIHGIKSGYGLNSISVISICLAFPRVLYSEMDGLLSDLKVLFLDHDLLSNVDGNVDAVLEVCEKIRMFYDLGCEMGKVGELMGRSKSIFVEHTKEVLMSKIEYFSKLNVQKDQIGLFLLSRPEIFGFDLEGRVISVSGFLEHFGLEKKEVESLQQKYPHVFGRNRMANLPHVMRSMDLGEWFFEKMKRGNHTLLVTYAIRSMEDDVDKHYMDSLKRLRAKRTYIYAVKKLNFLHSIGFGENRFAVKTLSVLSSSSSQLQLRFDCLLHCGIEYSKLCAMVKLSGKILNQHESILEKKLEFLCNDMGSSLQYLNVFPGYLCYDLEQRIKPRFELHKWLMDQGLCEKEYSLSTIIASSEKTFIARLSRIHPAAPKKWRENSLKKRLPGSSPLA